MDKFTNFVKENEHIVIFAIFCITIIVIYALS